MTITTDTFGFYKFDNLMPGTYITGIKRVPVEDVLYLFYCPCYSERGNSSDWYECRYEERAYDETAALCRTMMRLEVI